MTVRLLVKEYGRYMEKSVQECSDYGLIKLFLYKEEGNGLLFGRRSRFCKSYGNHLLNSVSEFLSPETFCIYFAYNKKTYRYLYSMNLSDIKARIEISPDGLTDKDWDNATFFPGLSPDEVFISMCPDWLLEEIMIISDAVYTDLMMPEAWMIEEAKEAMKSEKDSLE